LGGLLTILEIKKTEHSFFKQNSLWQFKKDKDRIWFMRICRNIISELKKNDIFGKATLL